MSHCSLCACLHPGAVMSRLFLRFSKVQLLWIGFITTIILQGHGAVQCPNDGNVTGTTGSISSPSFPKPYPDDVVCVWVISVPRGNYVKLTLETVDMEYCTLCRCDYVEVRDGTSSTGQLIGRFCSERKTVLYSEGRHVWVTFKSDAGNEKKGLFAKFSRVKLRKKEPVILHVNETSRSIKSSKNPAVCGSEKQCTWTIHANQAFNVRLTFDSFDIPSCSGSFVEVRDGRTSEARLIGIFCGDAKPSWDICSTGRDLWIKYKYNSTRDLRVNSFRITYRKEKCTRQMRGQLYTEPVNSEHLRSMAVGIACTGLILFVTLVTCFLKIASNRRSAALQPGISQIELYPAESSTAESPLNDEIDTSLSD